MQYQAGVESHEAWQHRTRGAGDVSRHLGRGRERDAGGLRPGIYIALKPGITPSKSIEDKVVRVIETVIGKIARPKGVRIVPDMPKTRSGKIMRRVLASISNTMEIGDVTTLANFHGVGDGGQHPAHGLTFSPPLTNISFLRPTT